MNCRDYQDQMLEQFGDKNLPADLAKHIESCAECRKVWTELHTLDGQLDDNAAFYPKSKSAEIVAEAVEREIRTSAPVTEVYPMRWLRYASVAAAVVLIASTAVVWRMSDRLQEGSNGLDTIATIDGYSSDWDNFDDEMPSGTVTTLLEEYVERTSSSAGEQLLGDLTDEEVDYLASELKQGDLL